jgi:hypothetical protein
MRGTQDTGTMARPVSTLRKAAQEATRTSMSHLRLARRSERPRRNVRSVRSVAFRGPMHRWNGNVRSSFCHHCAHHDLMLKTACGRP